METRASKPQNDADRPLHEAYATAWQEWMDDGNGDAWEVTVGDGLHEE